MMVLDYPMIVILVWNCDVLYAPALRQVEFCTCPGGLQRSTAGDTKVRRLHASG